MNKQEAICELGSMIGYFQTQYSIKESEGTLEDGEAAAFANRFEALHQGMTALDQIDSIESGGTI